MLQHYRPIREIGPHGHGRENEKSLLYICCDFSGWYNLGKITKFDFDWSSVPDPAGGAYSAPSAGSKGTYFQAEGGERKERVNGEVVEVRGGRHSLARPLA